MATLGVYCSGPAEATEPWLPGALASLTASVWPADLGGGARRRWVSFFFTPAPGRLQLAGLQPGAAW